MREITPLSLWGGDTLIYRSIIGLAAIAALAITGVSWSERGAIAWPQLALAGALLVIGIACLALSKYGRREIAAAVLIGTFWISVTIYAFQTGYGMHSAAVFIYLPCLLYTALFFGLSIAAAELALTIAVLVLMYAAEESGRLGGAAALLQQGTNFNFLLGLIVTFVGTLVAALVYHRRVESEAARVTAEAAQHREALEKAQVAQAQLETANAKLHLLAGELAARASRHDLSWSRARRDMDLMRDIMTTAIPKSLADLRKAVVSPEGPAEKRLQHELDGMQAVLGALVEIARQSDAPLQRADVDLSALGREIALELGPHAVRVRFEIEPGLHADGDRAELAVLLRHLLSFAASACRGEPEPQVRLGGGSLQGRMLFYVRDNGPGMDETQIEKLFRIEDAADIGMVSARRIAERHAGDLWLESRPGRGTSCFFTLLGD